MNSSAAERVHGQSLSVIQWRIQGRDPGGAGHPFIFRPNRDPKGRKIFWETGSSLPHLRVWRTWTPPPHYLKVWIWHCYAPINVNPLGGGGECGQGVGIDKFQNFLIKFPRVGNERSIKSDKKDPTPGEKI